MSFRTLGLLGVFFTACGGPRPIYVEPPVRVDVVVTPGVATLTWEPGLNAQSVLVARTPGNVEASPPDGGGVGDRLGEGVVLYVGEGTKLIDANLPDNCGPFAWHVWSRASDGTWAKTAATGRSLRGEHTLAPTAEISNLTSTFEGSVVRLRWSPPEASTAFELVNVLRKAGSAPSSINDGILVYSGPSATATDALTNLSPSVATYYAVFNCNSCGKCGATAPSVAIASPADGGASLTISGLSTTLSADHQTVELAWSSTAPRVKVLRTLNGAPSGPNDTSATVIFDGAGSSVSERVDRLLPHLPLEARTYTYSAWGCLGSTCSSSPASTPRALTLRQALQGGGYTLFWRHATAGLCQDATSLGTASSTSTPGWWKSCNAVCASATAEQLTPATSDAELALVRTFFQGNGISVSRVVSSEFCRAVRTAEGFQFGPTIEQAGALTSFVYDDLNRCRDTSSLLNAPPAPGTNVAHVGHATYPAACPLLDSLEPAEAVIYKPSLGAPPRFIARVSAVQWGALP